MAVVFCTPFDTDFDSCNGDSPSFTGANTSIDTSIKKFGAGSVKGARNIELDYDPFSDSPDNEGAIGVWMYVNLSKAHNGQNLQHKSFFDNASRIFWAYQLDDNIVYPGIPGYSTQITMHDSGGVQRVNQTVTVSFAYTGGWHYWELNWKWNDGAGKTEVFLDGVSVLSNVGGNSYSRSGSDITFLRHDNGSNNDDTYIDDYTIWDARQHTSGFTNPATPNCICAAAAKRLLTLGSPFGMNPLGN